MSDLDFYQARAGRELYDKTMPELARQIARLNELLVYHCGADSGRTGGNLEDSLTGGKSCTFARSDLFSAPR